VEVGQHRVSELTHHTPSLETGLERRGAKRRATDSAQSPDDDVHENGCQQPLILLRNRPGRHAVDTEKGRFSNACSGVVFPFAVARMMDLSGPLRFQSYGWNLNVRAEVMSPALSTIRSFLTYQEMARYTRAYFEVVDPCYHFLDQNALLSYATQYWTAESDFVDDAESVLAGVAALGSFFSKDPSSNETRAVEHSKLVLDAALGYAPGKSSLSLTAGWILRTLYLRLTTRPALSWYASATTVHVAEANALHVDLSTTEVFNSEPSFPPFISARSDVLDAALFLNSMISAEYGRSPVVLQHANFVSATKESQLLGWHHMLTRTESDLSPAARVDMLSSLLSVRDTPPVLGLVAIDIALHIFRCHWNQDPEDMRTRERTLLLSLIRLGFERTRKLLSLGHAWWNVLSTPFQSLMVLLALDGHESLALVDECVSVLRRVHLAYPTHLASEVMLIVTTLLRAMKERKSRQVAMLDGAIGPEPFVNQEEPTLADAPLPSTLEGSGWRSQVMLDDWLALDVSNEWLPSDDLFRHQTSMESF
jgi:hypothetical protein